MARAFTGGPTDKAYVSRPAEFLRLQLRLRVAVFAVTVAVAAVLALMGVWWWPAFFLAIGLLFVLERLAGKGRNPGSRAPPKGDTR